MPARTNAIARGLLIFSHMLLMLPQVAGERQWGVRLLLNSCIPRSHCDQVQFALTSRPTRSWAATVLAMRSGYDDAVLTARVLWGASLPHAVA